MSCCLGDPLIAAANGHTDCLERLVPAARRKDNPYIILHAMRNRHFDTVQWMINNGFEKISHAVTVAAQMGCNDMLQLLANNDFDVVNTVAATKSAARLGHIDTLRWLMDNGCGKHYEAIEEAVNNGHIACAHFMLVNNFPFTRRSDVELVYRAIAENTKMAYECLSTAPLCEDVKNIIASMVARSMLP